MKLGATSLFACFGWIIAYQWATMYVQYIPEVKKKEKKRGKKGFAAVRIGLLIRKYPLALNQGQKKKDSPEMSRQHMS